MLPEYFKRLLEILIFAEAIGRDSVNMARINQDTHVEGFYYKIVFSE